MDNNRHTLLFVTAMLLGLIALCTSFFWIYYIALFVALPSGLIVFGIWLNIRKDGRKRNILIPFMLSVALFLSLASLFPWIINLMK